MCAPKTPLSIYVLQETNHSNVGDEINAHLIPKLFGIPLKTSPLILLSDIISIGSTLGFIAHSELANVDEETLCKIAEKKITVWGSGFMNADDADDRPLILDVEFLSVRGKLTRDKVIKIYGNGYENLPIGDPGLLAAKYLDRPVDKKHKIGLIPHYVDTESPIIKELTKDYKDIFLIDVRDSVDIVLEQIASCEVILSTAMHGLVFADSFGIPNLWLRVSDKIGGGNFKFLDYYSALDLEGEMQAFDLRHKHLPKDDSSLICFVKDNYKVDHKKVERICQEICDAFTKKYVK